MSPNLAAVLAAAEALTVDERYKWIDRLLQGLDSLAGDIAERSVPVLGPAWRQEIGRRSAEHDANRAETVSWQDVQARWLTP